MANNKKVKDYADTWLYSKGNYEKGLFNFMMHCNFVDPSNQIIQDITDDLKRRRSGAYLTKVLNSPNTKICVGGEPLPRAFKCYVAKDIRGTNKSKNVLYVDFTGILKETGKNTYEYNPRDIDIIVSYLTGGMNAMIYYNVPDKILNNHELNRSGCRSFSSLVFYIIDYLRLSGDPKTRGKVIYYASKYYQLCILNKEMSSSIENLALSTANITENEAAVVEMQLDKVPDPYANLANFVSGLAAITRSEGKLTVDTFVDKWMYHIGVGTQFGLELYPAFANILIYAYVGAYLNHQKTIEKTVGNPMVDFVSRILAMGSEII